ncbi:MAG TPA: hypothetical protein DD490_00645, partial [Acidobacteria bacterium]|nr:hypothetical protein [Acidobacteriota bacterium]
GQQVHLILQDQMRNNRYVRDVVSVSVTSPAVQDNETVSLQETGVDTGVFRGTVALSTSASTPNDGVLEAPSGVTINASLIAADGVTSATDQAQIVEGVLLLLDAAGNPVTTLLESERVRVRLISPATPGFSVSVQVTAALSSDSETLVLVSDGAGSFNGELPSALSWGYFLVENGWLSIGNVEGPPYQGDTVTVTWSGGGGAPLAASAGFVPSRLSFLDDQGRTTTSYPAGSEVHVRLERRNDTSPLYESFPAVLANPTTGEEESLSLLETAGDSGVFIGSMYLSGLTTLFDGELGAQPGEQIEARSSGSTQTAAVVGVALTFLDEHGEPTGEVVESSPARVRLFSLADNLDGAIVESAVIELGALGSFDTESLTLTETGPDTGLFEGSILLEMGSYGNPDGKLQTENSGPPAYRGDVVTARYGAFEATARTIGARIEFLDAFGRPTDSLTGGVPVQLRIFDPFQTLYGNSFTVSLWSSKNDEEPVTMQETSPTSAVFLGSIPSSLTAWAGPDGLIAVAPGGIVEVRHATSFNPFPLTRQATIRGSSLVFVDAAGQPAEVYLESTQARLRLVSALDNASPGSVDTVSVQLTAELSSDAETLTLTETGPDTGVFTGAIPLRLTWGYGPPGNGLLETTESTSNPPGVHRFDVLHASFTGVSGETTMAEIGLTGSRTWFGNAAGSEVLSYAVGSSAYIWVEDQNWNIPGQWNQVQVVVQSPATGDQEYLTLQETTRDSGIFVKVLPLTAAPPQMGNGVLSVVPGGQIEASHGDSFGATASSAVANVVGSALEFIDGSGAVVAELVEGGTARVRLLNLSGNQNAGVAETVTVTLESLQSGDTESLVLNETGADTSLFEGSLAMAYGPGGSGNGTLETLTGDAPEYLADAVTARHGSVSATVPV